MNYSSLILLVILCLTPFASRADPAHCVAPSGTHITDNRVDVYLHFDSFEDFIYDLNGNLGGLTVDEVLGAMLQGMEQWNHSAAGREFRYMGTTTLIKGGCGFGVVRGGKIVGGQIVSKDGPATMLSECFGEGFSLEIPAGFTSGTPRRWVTGDPALASPSNRSDLVGFFAHEFGHAVGIGHPLQSNAHGVMNNNTKRDLFQIDIECAEVFYDGGTRSASIKEMTFTSGSTSTSTLYSGYWTGAPGVSAGGGSGTPDRFRGARMGHGGPWAERYSSSLIHLDQFLMTTHTPQPPIRIHRRELNQAYRDAIIFQKKNADNYGLQESEKFRQRMYVSPTGFDNSGNYYTEYYTDLRHCTSPSGSTPLASCSSSEHLHSGHRVSAGFDTAVNRSVYAWTMQDRTNYSSTHNGLRVSIGSYGGSYYNSAILGFGFSAGVRSDVAPAVACKENQAGSSGYDCMIAYTDITDPKNSVRFKRFDSTASTSFYYPTFESGHHQIDSAGWPRTASPIALFHHNGKWWVAFKLALATGSGGVRLYSSTNGNTGTWTLHSTTGYTATGATGIGDWMVSNRLRWAD